MKNRTTDKINPDNLIEKIRKMKTLREY